ncbi:MAG: branched-chain amino acid ABC transporter permease [Polyangiaceae bacterium]|nr:branched-chain amino acid ABC transporter permease [Polyangiaceae bacterium]
MSEPNDRQVARRGPRSRTTTVALLVLAVVVLCVYPHFPFVDRLFEAIGHPILLDRKLVSIFIFGILALALNVQVGYAGLQQLGIAAFFGIGAYTTGILTVEKYPFHAGFWGALVAAPVCAAIAGLAIGAPTLRLRGDYFAIVTLGFGEVVRTIILNLEGITDGPRGLNPIPDPWLPPAVAESSADPARVKYLALYYIAFVLLVGLAIVFRNLERTRLGRALVALREDELATACMGINPVRIKLVALAVGAGLAGLAGALYSTTLTTTAEPSTYDFNYSIMVLCCLIIGGVGSLRGAILGAVVLFGFDNIVSPLITELLQPFAAASSGNVFLQFNNWRWIIFGLALVLMMRFRPEGLWPSSRMKAELHHEDEGPLSKVGP